MTEPGSGYGTPPQARSDSNTLSIIGIVCGAVAVFFLPIVIGVVGIVCAALAKRKGERLSTPALVVAVAGTVLGFVLGALFFASQT